MPKNIKCRDCNDTGHISRPDPEDTLGVNRRERCHCSYVAEAEALYKKLVDERFRTAQWHHYVASTAIRTRVAKGESFWLWGPTGTGKTLLACCKLKSRIHETIVLAREEGAFFFFEAAEFFKALQAQYDDTKEGAFEFDWLSRNGFIVLDDLDKRKSTPEREDMLYRFFNQVWARALPCIVTTNMTPAKFCGKFFSTVEHRESSLSRILHHFEIVECAGPDFRLRNIKKK